MSVVVYNSSGGIHLVKFRNQVNDVPSINSIVEMSGKKLSCGNTISWVQSSGLLKIPFNNSDFIVPLDSVIRFNEETKVLDVITREDVLNEYKINI